MPDKESVHEKFAAIQEKIERNAGEDISLFVTIKTAREAGIAADKIKAYALNVFAGDLKRGYGHPDVVEMIHRIAKNTNIATPDEISALVATTPVEQRPDQQIPEAELTDEDPVQAAIDKYCYESVEHQLAAWEAYEKQK